MDNLDSVPMDNLDSVPNEVLPYILKAQEAGILAKDGPYAGIATVYKVPEGTKPWYGWIHIWSVVGYYLITQVLRQYVEFRRYQATEQLFHGAFLGACVADIAVLDPFWGLICWGPEAVTHKPGPDCICSDCMNEFSQSDEDQYSVFKLVAVKGRKYSWTAEDAVTESDDGWYLFAKIEGMQDTALPWPKDWPKQVNARFLEAHGFETTTACGENHD